MTGGLMQQVFKEHRRLLAVVLLLAVSSGLFWICLLVPQQRQRDELHAAWTEKRARAHDPENARSVRVYRSNEHALQKLFAAVPAQSELPRVLGQLTDVAALHEANIMSMSYKPIPSSVNGLLGYTLVASVQGEYGALKRVLSDIQALHDLAYVDSVSIAAPDPQANQAVLEARLVLYLRQEGKTP